VVFVIAVVKIEAGSTVVRVEGGKVFSAVDVDRAVLCSNALNAALIFQAGI